MKETASFDSGKGTLSVHGSTTSSDALSDRSQISSDNESGTPSPRTMNYSNRPKYDKNAPKLTNIELMPTLKRALQAPPLADLSAGTMLRQPQNLSQHLFSTNLRDKHMAVASLLEQRPAECPVRPQQEQIFNPFAHHSGLLGLHPMTASSVSWPFYLNGSAAFSVSSSSNSQLFTIPDHDQKFAIPTSVVIQNGSCKSPNCVKSETMPANQISKRSRSTDIIDDEQPLNLSKKFALNKD